MPFLPSSSLTNMARPSAVQPFSFTFYARMTSDLKLGLKICSDPAVSQVSCSMIKPKWDRNLGKLHSLFFYSTRFHVYRNCIITHTYRGRTKANLGWVAMCPIQSASYRYEIKGSWCIQVYTTIDNLDFPWRLSKADRLVH